VSVNSCMKKGTRKKREERQKPERVSHACARGRDGVEPAAMEGISQGRLRSPVTAKTKEGGGRDQYLLEREEKLGRDGIPAGDSCSGTGDQDQGGKKGGNGAVIPAESPKERRGLLGGIIRHVF